MCFEGPSSGKSRHLLLTIIIILTFCLTSFGKEPRWNSGGSSSWSTLAISSVGPSSGPDTGGTTVIITGTGFWHSTSVAFGGVAAPSVIYISSNELQATTPAHPSGTVTVSVEGRQNRSATLAGGFTYTAPDSSTSTSSSSSSSTSTSLGISGISPSEGPTSGGTVVTITGTGFQTGDTVAFGSLQPTAVTVTSSTEINAVSPPENAGTVTVTVTGSGSQSASLPSAFTYTSGPSISSISPNSGPLTGGTTVTIMGSGFQSGASVAFGGITATSVNVVSSTEIQAVTSISSAGTVSVAVANPDSRTGTLTSAFTFFHTVSMAWTGSTSSITGYNVYRSSTSGGPYAKLNSALVSSTSFSDNNVQAGRTYFYVTTAVDSTNVESGYSNQAQASVPSP